MSNPLPPSDPRRGRRRQCRTKGRPSGLRCAARRAAQRTTRRLVVLGIDKDVAEELVLTATPKRERPIIADEATRLKQATEALRAVHRRELADKAVHENRRTVRRRFDAAADAHAAELDGRATEQRARDLAVRLGAEMWRRQVTKVVVSIADKVEGMANMAGAEIAELGNALEATRRRLELLELSNAALAAKVKNLAKRGPRGPRSRLTRQQRGDLAVASKRRTARGGAR